MTYLYRAWHKNELVCVGETRADLEDPVLWYRKQNATGRELVIEIDLVPMVAHPRWFDLAWWATLEGVAA